MISVGVKLPFENKLEDELSLITSDVKDYGDDMPDHLAFPEIPDMKGMDMMGMDKDLKSWKYDDIDADIKKIKKMNSKAPKMKKLSSKKNPDAKLDGIDLPHLRRAGSEEWSYRRIRDLIALLHVGLFEYADRLSSYITYSTEFRSKFLKCRKRLIILIHQLKNLVQDKIKLQDLLKDLSSKYKLLEHALKKAGDINQDNKETVEKIRVNRDKCIRTIDNRNDVVASLRNQNAELRRHLASLRTSKFNSRLRVGGSNRDAPVRGTSSDRDTPGRVAGSKTSKPKRVHKKIRYNDDKY